MNRRIGFLAAALCALLLGVGPGSASAAPSSLQRECVEAGVAPLPALGGRAFIANRAGFSSPRLDISWRSPRMPAGCEGHFHRSVAVAVTLRTDLAPSAIPIGQGRGRGPVDWLIFIEGFKPEPSGHARAEGLTFGEPLGCIERVTGLVRYEVTDANGHLLRKRVAGYEPRFRPCR